MTRAQSSNARVTVGVLTYRREDALARVLDSIAAQRLPNIETIVVDNGSGPDIVEGIRTNYPWCRLIALTQNKGTCARNEILRSATGDIVVMLDNDVYFDNGDCVAAVVQAFDRHPRAGCVVFRVYHPDSGRLHGRDWCHAKPAETHELKEFETHFITEGACAFRRSVFEEMDGYWCELWIGHEGLDLSLRLLDRGNTIIYAPEVKVWHMAAPETRENWRPYYFNTRNLFLVGMRDYPWVDMPALLVGRTLLLGFYAARYGHAAKFLLGLKDGVLGMWRVRRIRKPVRSATISKAAYLRRDMPNVWRRFMRHWRRGEF